MVIATTAYIASYVWRQKKFSHTALINLDGIRTRNRWIRSPTRYPIAPQGHSLCAMYITPYLRGLW